MMSIKGHPWPAVKVSIFPQLQHPIASYLASRMGRGKIGADRVSLRRQSTSVCVDTRPLQIEQSMISRLRKGSDTYIYLYKKHCVSHSNVNHIDVDCYKLALGWLLRRAATSVTTPVKDVPSKWICGKAKKPIGHVTTTPKRRRNRKIPDAGRICIRMVRPPWTFGNGTVGGIAQLLLPKSVVAALTGRFTP